MAVSTQHAHCMEQLCCLAHDRPLRTHNLYIRHMDSALPMHIHPLSPALCRLDIHERIRQPSISQCSNTPAAAAARSILRGPHVAGHHLQAAAACLPTCSTALQARMTGSPAIWIISGADCPAAPACCRYCEDKFISKYIPTIGVDYGVKPVAIGDYEVSCCWGWG